MAVLCSTALCIRVGEGKSGNEHERLLNFHSLNRNKKLVPVAARSTAWFCGRSVAGIAGSNHAQGMDILLLYLSCVV